MLRNTTFISFFGMIIILCTMFCFALLGHCASSIKYIRYGKYPIERKYSSKKYSVEEWMKEERIKRNKEIKLYQSIKIALIKVLICE